jgi:nucleoside-diphosphate-sugar epimerase
MNVFVCIGDALDRIGLTRVLADARPTHVIHQLTALPKAGVSRASDIEPTNRLRIDGTRNLLDAAIQAGARRFLVGSFAMMSSGRNVGRDCRLPVVRNDAGLLPVINIEDAASATVLALDRATPGAIYDIVDDHPVSMAEFVTTIAEYTGSSPPRRVPAWIPRLLAPYLARLTSMRVPLSNPKTKAELGWRPKYPTIRDGLAPIARRAA